MVNKLYWLKLINSESSVY